MLFSTLREHVGGLHVEKSKAGLSSNKCDWKQLGQE